MDTTKTSRGVGISALAFLVLATAVPAQAQPSADECSARLARARSQYEVQQFAEVERLIVECVDRHALPAGEMDEGFRLLTLGYLRENLLAEAQTTVIKHLAWSFTYEPDEVRDPPLYVALVRVTKAQLTVPPAALLASASPAGAPAQTAPAQRTVQPPSDAGTHTSTGPETHAAESATTETPTEIGTQPPSEPTSEQTDEPATGEGSEPIHEATRGSAALALREREPLPEPASREASTETPTETDHRVGLVGDVADAGSSGATSGRYGGGLSSVPGTTPRALLIPLPADAHSDKEDPYNEALDFATQMPEIIGGPEAIRLEYPDFERRAGIEGRVVVRFVVDEQGDIAESEVLRGVGPGLDAAALAALHRLRFTPARQNGQPARVRMTLTFRFQAPGRDNAN